MIEILQGYDRAPIVTLETDDASALESKLSAAARLSTDRKSWQKPLERIAILRRLSVLLEGKREQSTQMGRGRAELAACGARL